jgi:uncharacterized protein YndB with AHSA1/START domain
VDRNFYRFRSVWHLDAPPHDVYDALERLPDYPTWWREVRETVQLTDDSYRVRCQATLPYDLVFTSTQERRDPVERVLQARLVGDLDGFSRWTIAPSPSGGTDAVFEEEVVATKPLLRRLAPVARPAFKANHLLMMRHGQAGLRTYLAGWLAAREP